MWRHVNIRDISSFNPFKSKKPELKKMKAESPLKQYEHSVIVKFTDSEMRDIEQLAEKHDVSIVFYIQIAVYRQIMDGKLIERTIKSKEGRKREK